LSIVIPVTGNVAEMERTLVSVLANRPADCEVVVVLNQAYDDPYDLSDEVRFLSARLQAGFVECANQGIRSSRTGIVHILAAGLEVSEGWADAAIEHFADPQVAAVAPLILSAQNGRPLAAGLRYGSGGKRIVNAPRKAPSARASERIAVLGPCAAAAFYSAEALSVVGGGLPNVLGNDLADVQLALELQAAGYRAVLEAGSQVMADRLPSWDGRGFQHGLYAERLFWLHASERGTALSMGLHPFAVVGDLLRTFSPAAAMQIAGRLLASCQFGFYRQPTHRKERKSAKLPDGLRVDAAHEMGSAGRATTVSSSERARS
jgi:hypothetical protein